jgi:hypothetical protein|tara:strand:- start:2582 stop:2839 length:258 start_codon:yes stop_codon:yes gene_type:complete
MDKDIKFISGIYATQHRDWCHRIAINVKQFEEQFKLFKENANEKGFYEFEMLKSKKGKLYFKEKDLPRQEVTSQDHSPDRDPLPF